MPGLTGRYIIIKKSKRQRVMILKAITDDSDYSKMCKTQTKVSNQKSSKEEAKRLKREKKELKESKMASEKQSELKFQKKEQHIAQSADHKLSKAKRENEEKKKISDLQHLHESKKEILADRNAKLEATPHLEEAQEKIKNLNNKVHVLEKESTLLAVCARTNTVIHDDGMDNSLNERISDLSDGEDNPPSDYLIQSDINYNSIVVAENNNNFGQNLEIVTNVTSDSAVNSNEDHCRLSSDCADKSETVPSSADSIKPNGMVLCV